MCSLYSSVGSVEWHFTLHNIVWFPGMTAQKARGKVQAKVQSCVCAVVTSAASMY